MSDFPRDHNNPPSQIDLMREKFTARTLAVEAIAERANAAPRAIKADADLAIVGALVKDARELFRDIDNDRKIEKDPYLTAGREVDAFFAVMTDRLNRIGEAFRKIADDYARAKAAEARRKAEEEARSARAEADRQAEIARRAEEANRAKTAATHDARAEAAEVRAEQAEQVAASSAADLTRQRFDSGVLSTAKTEWSFEITDYESIPLARLRPYLKREAVEAAIRLHVKLHKDQEPLPGIRVFEDVKAVFR